MKANTHKGVSCNQSIKLQTYDFRDGSSNPDEPGPSGINTEERKSEDVVKSDLKTIPSQDIMDDPEKGQANSSEDPSIDASRESLRNTYPRAGQRLQQVIARSYERASTVFILRVIVPRRRQTSTYRFVQPQLANSLETQQPKAR